MSANLISQYAKLLGVRGSELPTAFDARNAQTFAVFVKEFSLVPDTERNALFLALEFMRYMRSLGLGVCKRMPKLIPIKNDVAKSFSPQAVYDQILLSELQTSADAILTALRKTHLLTSMNVVKSKVEVSGIRGLVLQHHVQLNAKRETLSSVLHKLQGSLYSATDVPTQLRDVYTKVPAHSKLGAKIITPSAAQRIQTSSCLGWLVLNKSDKFSMYAVRAASDIIVLRILVPIDSAALGFIPANTVKKTVPVFWKKILKEYS